MFDFRKLDPWATIRRCLRDRRFSRFGTIQACDRRKHDDSIYRASIASRGNEWKVFKGGIKIKVPKTSNKVEYLPSHGWTATIKTIRRTFIDVIISSVTAVTSHFVVVIQSQQTVRLIVDISSYNIIPDEVSSRRCIVENSSLTYDSITQVSQGPIMTSLGKLYQRQQHVRWYQEIQKQRNLKHVYNTRRYEYANRALKNRHFLSVWMQASALDASDSCTLWRMRGRKCQRTVGTKRSIL